MRYLDTSEGEMHWTEPSVGAPAAPPIPGSESEFHAMSWEQLAQMSAACASAGATDYQKLLGFTKPISVSGVGTVTTRLIGLCHDTYVDGGTAGFTFQLQDGLSASKPVNMQMNASNITTGGWRDSVMRKTNIPALLAALPADLRAVIKKVTKKSSTSESGTAVVETEDDLFLLSLIESIGTTKTAYTNNLITSSTYMVNEGSQYEYYRQFDSNKTEAFNHHIIKADTGGALIWWLRSVGWNSATVFCLMNTSGDWSILVASNSYLPAAGFCIAPPPPPPLYLAGDWKGENNDQPQTVEWIDADTDHKFYDETGSWSVIDNGPKTYSISYKGTNKEKDHDHSNYFQNPPSQAAEGESVTVNLDNVDSKQTWSGSWGTTMIGITDASLEDITDPSQQLEQITEINDDWYNMTYTFTMPDHDVTVWFWCATHGHQSLG